jgi:signal transduction histidine kinase
VTADDALAGYQAVFAAERIRAVGFIPLIAGRRLLGKFMLYWAEPRTFSARDAALAAVIGVHVAEALERARLQEAERRDYEAERAARERAEAAEARMSFLAEASVQLSSSLDYQVTLRKVAELAVPGLADWCVIDIGDGRDGALDRVAIVHSDPAKVEFAQETYRRYPPRAQMRAGVAQVMRAARSELYRDSELRELIVATAYDAEHVSRVEALELRSAIVVPIIAAGRTFGVITFATAESQRRYTDADVQMAEELGRRAGIAIENARLYEEEKRLRLEAQSAEQRHQAAAAELQRTLRDNELFAGILAHDLRSPLAAILTAVQFLVQEPERGYQRAAETLGHIMASGARMSRLIEQLLDFTRMRAGGAFKLERCAVDLETLCDQVATEIGVAQPDWELVLECYGDCGGAWDPDRLLQVLANLISNAGQHGSPGQAIRVTLDGQARDAVVLTVHNRGVVPKARLPELFAPFTGLHEGKSAGLGLGLFITKQIVVAHGGHIDVTSSAAEGTTFGV